MVALVIIALTIVGKRPEPFLGAALESICDAVDLVVMNDNSQDPASPNAAVARASRLGRDGKIHILPSAFEGFAAARNRCLDYIRALNPGPCWVLKQDADEVHTSALAVVTRQLLPALPPRYAIVDGYFYQFMQGFDYFISMDRRHDLFFRFAPEVRWEGDIHERMIGLSGKRLATPYVFFHYGYAVSQDDVLDKWRLYDQWGDKVYDTAAMAPGRLLDQEAGRCIRFGGRHPGPAEAVIESLPDPWRGEVSRYTRLVKDRQRGWNSIGNGLRHLNYRARIVWRALQLAAALGGRSVPWRWVPKMVCL